MSSMSLYKAYLPVPIVSIPLISFNPVLRHARYKSHGIPEELVFGYWNRVASSERYDM